MKKTLLLIVLLVTGCIPFDYKVHDGFSISRGPSEYGDYDVTDEGSLAGEMQYFFTYGYVTEKIINFSVIEPYGYTNIDEFAIHYKVREDSGEWTEQRGNIYAKKKPNQDIYVVKRTQDLDTVSLVIFGNGSFTEIPLPAEVVGQDKGDWISAEWVGDSLFVQAPDANGFEEPYLIVDGELKRIPGDKATRKYERFDVLPSPDKERFALAYCFKLQLWDLDSVCHHLTFMIYDGHTVRNALSVYGALKWGWEHGNLYVVRVENGFERFLISNN